jgi:hypothetical protein
VRGDNRVQKIQGRRVAEKGIGGERGGLGWNLRLEKDA